MSRAVETTHKIMSAIRSSGTRPEMSLRKALWNSGFRYRVNYRKLKGKPDIVFTKAKIAIFCDGDFWHGHNWALRGYKDLNEELLTYSDYWKEKIIKNIERDKATNEVLLSEGWMVIRIWESSIKEDLSSCVEQIIEQYQLRRSCKVKEPQLVLIRAKHLIEKEI